MSAAYAEIQEKAKKKLDPVGKSDGDVDNDGDKDSSDSYLLNRRKVIASKMKKEHHQKDENGKVIEHDGQEEVNEKISASGYARAKKYNEDQAREKDRKEQEYFANKAKTHKWDGKKWTKKESVEYDGQEVEEAYTVTNADKKGNTPAYQAYKAGKKNVKTGKPLYKAADHMKEEAAKRLGKTVQEMDDLCNYFVEHDIAISSNDLNEVMQTIDPEHTEYFLEKIQDLKGKKKGPVIINPKTVEDANESYGMSNAETAKKEAKLRRKEMIKVAAKKVGAMKTEGSMTVSYTHLTLPTILLV